MDSLDAISVVNERIKEFETEEIARKVLGYIYLQDFSLQQLIPLALGPDIAIQNLILTAKTALHLPSAAVDFSPISSLVNPISNADHFLQYAPFSSASPQHQPLSPWVAEARLWEYHETEQQAVPEFMGFKDQFEGRYFHGQYLPKNNSHNFGRKTNEFGYSDQVFLPGSLKRLEMEMTELLKSKGGGPIPISFVPMLYFERYGRTIRAQDYPTDTQRFGKPSTKLTKLLARLKNSIRVLHKPEGQHEIVLAEHVERNHPAPIVGGSCKIIFTFPVESSFTIRDISEYFSAFGPVEDVKIPRYQKGTYGFVTFSSSDTVEIILAKGNPHHICGICFFVKPAEVNYHSERKDHEQHDPSLYSSHMDTNSELQDNGRHEEINHIDPDRYDSIFGSAAASNALSDLSDESDRGGSSPVWVS